MDPAGRKLNISFMNDSNNDTSGTLDAQGIQYWEQILVAIIISLIAIAGLIGNSMIILAVSFSQKLHTPTNAFVVSLSIADLIISFFLIFYTVGVLGKGAWPIPGATWICKLTAFIILSCGGTCVYNLAAIGLNRLILISRPKIYPKIFRSWKLAICLAIPWVWPAVGALISQYSGLGKLGYDPIDHNCGIIEANEQGVGLSLVIPLINFPVPLVVITMSYTWIYIIVKKHNQSLTHSLESGLDAATIPTTDKKPSGQDKASSPVEKQKSSRKQIQITGNLFLVWCSYFFCSSPHVIFYYIPNVYHVLFYTRILTFLRSAINFVIYTYKHPEFKVVLRHMMTCSYQNIPKPTKLLKTLLTFRSAGP